MLSCIGLWAPWFLPAEQGEGLSNVADIVLRNPQNTNEIKQQPRHGGCEVLVRSPAMVF